jgi:hypothetical protein
MIFCIFITIAMSVQAYIPPQPNFSSCPRKSPSMSVVMEEKQQQMTAR